MGCERSMGVSSEREGGQVQRLVSAKKSSTGRAVAFPTARSRTPSRRVDGVGGSGTGGIRGGAAQQDDREQADAAEEGPAQEKNRPGAEGCGPDPPGRGAQRDRPPGDEAVDAVDPAEEVGGDDRLAQRDRDDVPDDDAAGGQGERRRDQRERGGCEDNDLRDALEGEDADEGPVGPQPA